jgi:hypothetical protein
LILNSHHDIHKNHQLKSIYALFNNLINISFCYLQSPNDNSNIIIEKVEIIKPPSNLEPQEIKEKNCTIDEHAKEISRLKKKF